MRILLSWICFYIGDFVWGVVEPILGRWFQWPYRLYNKFMIWSEVLQGDDKRGPWTKVLSYKDED